MLIIFEEEFTKLQAIMHFPGNVKLHIEELVCPVHGIHPIVEEDWDGLNIDCCCQQFHADCLQAAEHLMANPGNSGTTV